MHFKYGTENSIVQTLTHQCMFIASRVFFSLIYSPFQNATARL